MAALLTLRVMLMAVMPLTDPSEARYGVLAVNMARHGDFVEPMFIHKGVYQSFDGKPPLYFQAGGVACKIFGQNEFAVRLPSMLSALMVLGIVFYTVRRLAGRNAAQAAALFCLSSCVFYLFSGFCMTDMLLTLCVTGAVCAYMLFAGSEGRGKKVFSVLFFGFLGLGMVAKGPVAVVMSGLPVFVYVCAGRRWKELAKHAWILGPLVFVAVALPWYVLIAQRNDDFLRYFFVDENFRRFVAAADYGDKYGSGHDTFRGMALVWFAVANLPFLLLVAMPFLKKKAGLKIYAKGDFSTHPVTALSLLGCVCITGFWCLTSRALLAYLLPTVPLASMWLAVKLEEWRMLDEGWMVRTLKLGVVASCGVAWIGLGVAMYLGHEWTGKLPKWMYNDVLKIQRETPEYADAGFYFARREPYSAEFYLGERFRNHEPELVSVSVAKSTNDFLLVSKRYLKDIKNVTPRKVVFKNPEWTVYAPLTKGAE